MLLLAALPSLPLIVRHQAAAAVRIERPVTISKRDWHLRSEAQHREVIVRDEQGRQLLLRLVENQ